MQNYRSLTDDEINAKFEYTDESGRKYFTKGLSLFRRPAHGPRPNLCYEWRGFKPTHTSGWCLSKERLEEEFQKGNVVITKDGRLERRKYLEDYKGEPLPDFWNDIGNLTGTSTERTGYPTQKPVALAERIIRASCPEGGVVLDCFAGCAYVAVAAERLGRQWIACDINPRAWTVFKRQFNKGHLALLNCREPTEGQQVMTGEDAVTVHGPNELPARTSPADNIQVPTFRVPERKFKVPASEIPEREMLEMLLELSGWKAWCCGFANRLPKGEVIKTTRNFHLDHLNPKSLEGTSHQITNRAPLCPYHNTSKGNQRLHLAEYRQKIADADEMLVDSVNDLINLDEAVHRVRDIDLAWRMQHYPQMPMGLAD